MVMMHASMVLCAGRASRVLTWRVQQAPRPGPEQRNRCAHAAPSAFLGGQGGGESERFQCPPADDPRQCGAEGETEATQPHPGQACNDQRSATPAITQMSQAGGQEALQEN